MQADGPDAVKPLTQLCGCQTLFASGDENALVLLIIPTGRCILNRDSLGKRSNPFVRYFLYASPIIQAPVAHIVGFIKRYDPSLTQLHGNL